jgi:hypothetical protein
VYSAEQARAMVEQQAVAGSEFRVTCASSHRRRDDPIVFQNQSGVSHMHEFFGNRTTDAFSTLTSLRAGTNCDPLSDSASAGAAVRGGNAKAASPAGNPAARWSCTTQSQSNRDFLNCPPGMKVETYLDFPTWWCRGWSS